jgi:NAD-dependent SIR2 family protein deacetylase
MPELVFHENKGNVKMNERGALYLDSLRSGELAIFCGAGISKNSGLPLANELKQSILEKLLIDKKGMDEVMNSNLPFEAFMESLSENSDITKILKIFREGNPNRNHILIAKLANNGSLKAILTTNFDLLIEKAFKKEGLQENVDFKRYYNEEHFAQIDSDELTDKIGIFKIHGSADDMDSIRTTLKVVASKVLSDRRMRPIKYLFSSGKHKKVLILGYSCSDVFDITPQIQSIVANQKEIIFIEHDNRVRP